MAVRSLCPCGRGYADTHWKLGCRTLVLTRSTETSIALGPKGGSVSLRMVADPGVPPGEVWVVQYGKIVSKIKP